MNHVPLSLQNRSAPEPASVWLSFVTSATAPGHMSLMELDGYLTGVYVCPASIPPSLWTSALFASDDLGANPLMLQAAFAAVGTIFNQLANDVVHSLRRLESEKVCEYRPAFLVGNAKPSHDDVRTWARGFSRAMRLAPVEWVALAEDERTRELIAPLVGFMDMPWDPEFVPADDIEERLDEAAALIPRYVLLLRKIAELQAARPVRAQPARRTKLGRNDPCSCGSGSKYKRCCGMN